MLVCVLLLAICDYFDDSLYRKEAPHPMCQKTSSSLSVLSVWLCKSLSLCVSVWMFNSLLTDCLTVKQSVWFSVLLSVWPSCNLFQFHLSVCLSICLSACMSICLSACLSACLFFISLSTCLSVNLSVCQSVCMSICLYVNLSVCQSVCQCDCLTVSL